MKLFKPLAFALLILLAFTSCHSGKEATDRDRLFDALNNQLITAKVTRVGDTVRVVFPELAMFDFGKDEIKAEARPAFISFANILKNFSAYRIKVNGYTDNVGTDDINYDLSHRRALHGVDILKSNGVQEGRLSAEGMGPKNPLMSNDNDYGRSVNRRVEFLVY